MEEEKPKVLYVINNNDLIKDLDEAINRMNYEPVRVTARTELEQKLQENTFYAVVLSGTIPEEPGRIPKQNNGWDFLLKLVGSGLPLRLGYFSCTKLEDQYIKIEQECTRIHVGRKELIEQGIQELLS